MKPFKANIKETILPKEDDAFNIYSRIGENNYKGTILQFTDKYVFFKDENDDKVKILELSDNLDIEFLRFAE